MEIFSIFLLCLHNFNDIILSNLINGYLREVKMQRIIIANQNVEQNNIICQHLSKDKRLEIIGITDGGETFLQHFFEISPNILVLDSNIKNIKNIDYLLDNISSTISDKHICNIILTANKNEHLKLSNVSRIYKIIYDVINNLDDLSNTIDELYLYQKYDELTTDELNIFFLKTNIPLFSSGSYYVRDAIRTCYYYPDDQQRLDDIFSKLSKKYNKPNEAIRSGFRASLKGLNMNRESIDCPIMKYFDLSQNITPKDFLEISTIYFHQKNKK